MKKKLYYTNKPQISWKSNILFNIWFRNGKEVAGQVSDTLDILLDKDRYNRQMRPPGENLDTSPVQVQINMAIRSMGPVDEVRELFSLDCYFRQSWTDTRLRLL